MSCLMNTYLYSIHNLLFRTETSFYINLYILTSQLASLINKDKSKKLELFFFFTRMYTIVFKQIKLFYLCHILVE